MLVCLLGTAPLRLRTATAFANVIHLGARDRFSVCVSVGCLAPLVQPRASALVAEQCRGLTAIDRVCLSRCILALPLRMAQQQAAAPGRASHATHQALLSLPCDCRACSSVAPFLLPLATSPTCRHGLQRVLFAMCDSSTCHSNEAQLCARATNETKAVAP